MGLREITGNTNEAVCDITFQDIQYANGTSFSILLDDGFRVTYPVDFIKEVSEVTGGFLIKRLDEDKSRLYYHGKKIGSFFGLRHLVDRYFVILEHLQYGIILCNETGYTYFRPCKYKSIDLSEDKRNLLLLKEEGRPRFIPVSSLTGKADAAK